MPCCRYDRATRPVGALSLVQLWVEAVSACMTANCATRRVDVLRCCPRLLFVIRGLWFAICAFDGKNEVLMWRLAQRPNVIGSRQMITAQRGATAGSSGDTLCIREVAGVKLQSHAAARARARRRARRHRNGHIQQDHGD